MALSNYSGNESERFNIYIKGDVDFDGRITTTDLRLVKARLGSQITFSDEETYCADCDNDGRVTAKDSTILKMILDGAIDSTSQTEEVSTFAISRNLSPEFELTVEDIVEMTDEEFLEYLFGDIDYDTETTSPETTETEETTAPETTGGEQGNALNNHQTSDDLYFFVAAAVFAFAVISFSAVLKKSRQASK